MNKILILLLSYLFYSCSSSTLKVGSCYFDKLDNIFFKVIKSYGHESYIILQNDKFFDAYLKEPSVMFEVACDILPNQNIK